MNFSLLKHSGYREATEKMQELYARRNQLTADERTMIEALGKPNDIRDEAQALLHDSFVSTAVVTRDQLAQVRHEQRVVAEAIEIQKRTIANERTAASESIRNQARPAYKAIIKRMASILAALRDAAVQEREMRESLDREGVALTSEFILPYKDAGEQEGSAGRYDSIALWEQSAREVEML